MRFIWGWVLFGIAIVSLLFGGIVFPIALGTGSLLAGNEFLMIAQVKGIRPSVRIVRTMIISFVVVAALPDLPFVTDLFGKLPADFGLCQFPALLTIGICASFFRLLFRQKQPATIADIATTILGFVYVGWLPAHLELLRIIAPAGGQLAANPLEQPGLAYVWASLFMIFSTDVFAYYAGKNCGKHALYPEISPKKTVEGAIGGFIGSIALGTLVVWLSDTYLFACHPFGGWIWHGVLMGAVVSVATQLGDLCESLLKRDAGVKDSGAMIPGHGGVLDRGDGLIFGGAVAYYYVRWFVLGMP